MNYLLDSNIPILMVKNKKFNTYLEQTFFQNKSDVFAISIISLGEFDSIIKQNNWGKNKQSSLGKILQKLKIIAIDNQTIIENYGTIEAYSQGKLKNKPLPQGTSARNMGKNDLWISATTLTLDAGLITTDKDFQHLDKVFFDVHWIDVQQFV